jgi:membrane protease YdiL (CAAX protease family)
MAPSTPSLVAFSILSTILLSLCLASLGTWVWAIGRLWRGTPLLEDKPVPSVTVVPWGGTTVFLVIVLYLSVNMSVSRIYAAITGRQAPSSTAQRASPEERRGTEPAKAEKQPGDQPRQSQEEVLLQLAIINGLLLLLVPATLQVTSGASLAELGVSFEGWRRPVATGVVAALLMTPGVYAVQSLSVRVWQPQTHPVEEMVLDNFTVGAALMAVVSTMLLAPMIEELLFRGVLQGWLSRLFSDRSSMHADRGRHPLDKTNLSDWMVDETLPRDRPVVGGGGDQLGLASALSILMTSLFFAGMHLPQWPAPIAIFLLSLALGAIYQRTGRLLASIAMHGTFNGFSTLLLLLEALGREIRHLR